MHILPLFFIGIHPGVDVNLGFLLKGVLGYFFTRCFTVKYMKIYLI